MKELWEELPADGKPEWLDLGAAPHIRKSNV